MASIASGDIGIEITQNKNGGINLPQINNL